MIEREVPAGKQARLTLKPVDDDDDPVVLDSGALNPAVVEGAELGASFEYNTETNGLVFRPAPDVGAVSAYSVNADGQPGPGVKNFPIDVRLTTIAADAEPAESMGEGLELEDAGTPA